jgi:hypothetical protein
MNLYVLPLSETKKRQKFYEEQFNPKILHHLAA